MSEFFENAGGLLMAIATTGKDVLAKFFDEGAYSALYADGAVTAAFGRSSAQAASSMGYCRNAFFIQSI